MKDLKEIQCYNCHMKGYYSRTALRRPLADISLEVEGQSIMVEAAISSTLPLSMCLGTDVPEWAKLLSGRKDKGCERVSAVTTRAQARQRPAMSGQIP